MSKSKGQISRVPSYETVMSLTESRSYVLVDSNGLEVCPSRCRIHSKGNLVCLLTGAG
jgi:hypothetical protein